MRPGSPPPEPGDEADFDQAVGSLRGAGVRADVKLHEVPAPTRLAPRAFALSGEATSNQIQLATGRLVLLHDGAGHESWGSTRRLVAYVRADLEYEIATDPFLGGVGWSWLLDALDAHGADHIAAGGTVTRAASECFGAMAGQPGSAEVEVRASWTPLGTDLAPHLLAWCDLLCYAGGLPPHAPGVAPIPPARARAGSA